MGPALPVVEPAGAAGAPGEPGGFEYVHHNVTSDALMPYLQQQGWVQGLAAGKEVPLTDRALEPQPSACPCLAESA